MNGKQTKQDQSLIQEKLMLKSGFHHKTEPDHSIYNPLNIFLSPDFYGEISVFIIQNQPFFK